MCVSEEWGDVVWLKDTRRVESCRTDSAPAEEGGKQTGGVEEEKQ